MATFLTRLIRSALILMVLSATPWILVTIPNLPNFGDLSQSLVLAQQSWLTVQRGGLPTSGLMTACVVVIWLSWLRISVGFVGAFIRVIIRRPVRRTQRWSAKLAFWALMITPSVAVSMIPTAVQAVSETLETTENDFQSKPVSTPQILVSVLVASGVLLRLRASRRRSLRQGSAEISSQALDWESTIVREKDEMAVVRLELAIRTLMSLQAASFRMILCGRDGSMLVEFQHDRLARSLWKHHASRIWKLEAAVTLEQLVQDGRSHDGPIPVLIPVGTTTAGEVWVNLQEVGVFGVHGQGEEAEVVWRGLSQSLALSPFGEHVSLISVEEQGLRGRREIVVADEVQACLIAERLHSDDSPAVVLARHRLHHNSLVALLHRQQPLNDEFGVSNHHGRWYLHPTMTEIEPYRCTDQDLAVLDVLVPTSAMLSVPPDPGDNQNSKVISELLPPHRFIASVLGVPHVRHVSGTKVSFERNRSEELVIWLALHSSQQRRSIARGEMWSIAIKDATFSNVTSDVRRSLTVVEQPQTNEDWLGVTLTDELPLHPLIESDVHLLALCFDHARRRPEYHGREVLEYGLRMVTGIPFQGSSYLWRDSTGLSSEYSMLVVRAALLLADMYSEAGDDAVQTWSEGVYWATAQGLLAIPGHEDLVIRRLELHAHKGDQAALCAEWQSYCRALASDDWGDVDPSPKMVDVWRHLTQSS